MATKLILTCEHASNAAPKQYHNLIPKRVLATHRGYDIGTKAVYTYLKNHLTCYAQAAAYSRLLIEMNRSLNHPGLFSQWSSKLSENEKRQLIENLYIPYRNKIISTIKQALKKNLVIHIAVHSFTPVLHNIKRTTDIGLLYDPKKIAEKRFCQSWKHAIKANSDYVVKMNYPYKGTADGLTSYLNSVFPTNYIGIEIEINQKFAIKKQLAPLQHMLLKTLQSVISKMQI